MLRTKKYTSVAKFQKIFSKKHYRISLKSIYNVLNNYKFLFLTEKRKNKKNIPTTFFKSTDINFFLTLNKFYKNERFTENRN